MVNNYDIIINQLLILKGYLFMENIKIKSKKIAKISTAKTDFAKINVNIPRWLRSKTTIKAIVTAAIKEYVNKPAVVSSAVNPKRVL